MIKLNNVADDLGTPGNGNMHNIYGYGRENSPTVVLDSEGNQEINCNTRTVFRKTGGNATLTFTNMKENQQINIAMESTGSSYSLTFAGETFKWGGGSQPTPTATADKVDIYSFIKIAGIVYGNALQGF